ncbi:nitroreductase family protein [Sulfurisphaera ohwakuensis]|uniref:NADH-quinone oxidoreductase subunit E n=2 Tax=Sulfurisphaera ohwakuensis TaxID=69656 RepID=A0A650CES6_SULOH|nr:nitroreductase family protein [Sulfurisphaera ohwakuensis]QGR16351.1 NADH-quinone oxidoreductase subunit E [Sulfurisphaera ohwakuensis]
MNLKYNDMNDILEFLIKRRSVRSFQQKPVDLELIKQLIYVANHAPNSMNNEPWKFIIIIDEEIKKKLSTLHKGASHIALAPIGVAVVAEPEISPETWMVDVVNAIMYFVLAAHSVGLGVGWIAAYENKKAKEILGIPDNKVLVTLLSVGYPDPNYKPREKSVKNPESVMFLNKWGNMLIRIKEN